MNKMFKVKVHMGLVWITFLVGTCLFLHSAFAIEESDYPGYPLVYSVVGVVDGIENALISIEDSLYPFTSYCTFNKPHNLNTSKSAIKKGDLVALILNPNGEVVSVWFLPKEKD